MSIVLSRGLNVEGKGEGVLRSRLGMGLRYGTSSIKGFLYASLLT